MADNAPFDLLLAGRGKMGGAMLARWRELGLCRRIEVVDPSDPACHPSPETLPEDFRPGAVVLAVKPQTLPGMIDTYRRFAEGGALFVSIAAGKPLEFFAQHLGPMARVVRAMPNTPAAIGMGITAAVPNGQVLPDEKARAELLLSAVGEVVWLGDERLMDAVTALSGSGPAYVFLLIELLEKAGVKCGLAPDMAARLARQTVIGSAALAGASPELSPEDLRKNVTSPGGTTAAALSVLLQPGLQDIFDEALLAATKRAGELAG